MTRARANNLPRKRFCWARCGKPTDRVGTVRGWVCVYHSRVATILYTLWRHNLARRQNAGELTPPPPPPPPPPQPAVVLPVRWAVINLILYCYITRSFPYIIVSCRHVVFPAVCKSTRTRLISISRTPAAPAAKSRFIFFRRDVHTHVNNLYLYNVYKHII